MDEKLKQRLVGAAVLIGLAIIFIPALLDDSRTPEPLLEGSNIPTEPEGGFSSRIIPLDENALEESMQPETVDDEPAQTVDEEVSEAEESAVVEIDEKVGVSAWVVQLGSFSNEENAQALVAKLKENGYPAFIEKVFSSDEKAYRVRVGPEYLKSRAKALMEQLEKDVEIKGIIVKYP